MTMKRVLVPIEILDGLGEMLETALLFARRFGSRLEGVALQTFEPDLFAAGAFGGVPVTPVPRADRPEPQEIRRRFESFWQERAVPRAGGDAPGPSFHWQAGEPVSDALLGGLARVFDVTVFARPGPASAGSGWRVLEAALFESGRPILIAPPKPPATLGERVVIAWNCSTETARATALAMPLIEQAKFVEVLTIEGGTVQGPSGQELAHSLALNGIKASERTVAPGKLSTGEAILAEAKSVGCDLLVKGAYTQSRLRQMFFGGATSHILSAAELPVFMVH